MWFLIQKKEPLDQIATGKNVTLSNNKILTLTYQLHYFEMRTLQCQWNELQ